MVDELNAKQKCWQSRAETIVHFYLPINRQH